MTSRLTPLLILGLLALGGVAFGADPPPVQLIFPRFRFGATETQRVVLRTEKGERLIRIVCSLEGSATVVSPGVAGVGTTTRERGSAPAAITTTTTTAPGTVRLDGYEFHEIRCEEGAGLGCRKVSVIFRRGSSGRKVALVWITPPDGAAWRSQWSLQCDTESDAPLSETDPGQVGMSLDAAGGFFLSVPVWSESGIDHRHPIMAVKDSRGNEVYPASTWYFTVEGESASLRSLLDPSCSIGFRRKK